MSKNSFILKFISRFIYFLFIPIVNKIEKTCTYSPIFINWYYNLHKNQVRAEIQAARISSTTNVLFIGGGLIPHTAIRIANEQGAIVDVIDNRPSVIQISQKVTNLYNSQAKIKVFYGDGNALPLSKYEVIVIANHVIPKQNLLNRVINGSNGNSRIVFRHSNFYELLGELKQIAEQLPTTSKLFSKWEIILFHSYIIDKSNSNLLSNKILSEE